MTTPEQYREQITAECRRLAAEAHSVTSNTSAYDFTRGNWQRLFWSDRAAWIDSAPQWLVASLDAAERRSKTDLGALSLATSAANAAYDAFPTDKVGEG